MIMNIKIMAYDANTQGVGGGVGELSNTRW